MEKQFNESRIDSAAVRGRTVMCESISPPINGTKMTQRCTKQAWHFDKHRSLSGAEW